MSHYYRSSQILSIKSYSYHLLINAIFMLSYFPLLTKKLALIFVFACSNILYNNKYVSIRTKLFIWKTLLKPFGTYRLQFKVQKKKTNIKKIQMFQNLTFRKLLDALSYVSINILHTNLKLKLINYKAKYF